MGPVIKTIILVSIMVLPVVASAQTMEQLASKIGKDINNPALKVAVVRLTAVPGVEKRDVDVVQERLTTFLGMNKGFKLIERALLEKVLEEQKLQLSGAISTSTVKRIGELSGADIVVSGTVNLLIGDEVEVNARAVAVETGEVLSAGRSRIPRDWQYLKVLSKEEIKSSQTAEAANAYAKAEQYYADGKYGVALVFYTKAIEADVSFWDAYYGRSVVAALQDKWDDAISDLNVFLKARIDNENAYVLRGRMYYFKEQYGKAISDYNMAIELGANEAEVYFFRGVAMHCLWKWDDAIKDYSKAIALNPKSDEAYYWRARAYAGAGKNSQMAIADYTTAISLRKSPSYYAMRALNYHDNQQNDKAMKDIDMAINIDPSNPVGYFARAAIYNSEKKFRLALKEVDAAIGYDPFHADSLMLRAKLNYLLSFDKDKAISDYSRVIEVDSSREEAYLQRGKLYAYKIGDSFDYVDKAISDFNKAIELNPKNDSAYSTRGTLYATKRLYSLAFEDCNAAIELNPGTAKGYECFAETYGTKGDFPAAILNMNIAISRDPKEFGYYEMLASYYERNGEPYKAEESRLRMKEVGDNFLKEIKVKAKQQATKK